MNWSNRLMMQQLDPILLKTLHLQCINEWLWICFIFTTQSENLFIQRIPIRLYHCRDYISWEKKKKNMARSWWITFWKTGLTYVGCYYWRGCNFHLLLLLQLTTSVMKQKVSLKKKFIQNISDCIHVCGVCVLTSYLTSSPRSWLIFWDVSVIWGSRLEGSPICGFCSYTPFIFSSASLRSNRCKKGLDVFK